MPRLTSLEQAYSRLGLTPRYAGLTAPSRPYQPLRKPTTPRRGVLEQCLPVLVMGYKALVFSLRFIQNSFLALGAFSVLGTLLAALGSFFWFFDLFSHFLLHYLLLLSVAVALCLAQKRWVLGAVFLVFFSWNAYGFWPYAFPQRVSSSAASTSLNTPSIRLYHANLLQGNPNPQAAFEDIRRLKPDIVSLNEASGKMKEPLELSGLYEDYPYKLLYTQDLVLLSRFPITSYQRHSLIYPNASRRFDSWLEAELNIQGRSLKLLLAHAPLPITSHGYYRQERMLNQIAEKTANSQLPRLLVGDLNTTHWSTPMHHFTQASGLIDAQRRTGYAMTWFFPVGLPIDHALFSPGINLKEHKTGSFINSDHLPVLLEFSLES